MTAYFRVAGLEKYQHYRDRRPPWIKLHASILDDYDFGKLPDTVKAHAMLIWVLASQHDNRLPFDPAWIGQRIQAQAPVNLDGLLSAGFITLEHSASTPLAGCPQSAVVETEAERETERETEAEKIPSPAAPVVRSLKVTWLTPYWDAWVARYGAEPHAGQLTKHLKRPRDALGDPECVARWGRYLAATEGRFASPGKFAATHGEYRGTTDLDALIEREKARECG